MSRSERHGGYFSIAMGDIDNFKDYNDRYGHNQGNTTLQTVETTLVQRVEKKTSWRGTAVRSL